MIRLNAVGISSFSRYCLSFSFLFYFISLYSQSNTSYGTSAGNAGSENSSFGGAAGDKVTGIRNVFLGYASGYNFNSGNYNIYAGWYSGYNSDNASYNVFLGSSSGYAADGSSNVFIGYKSGYQNDGSRNVFLGSQTGHSNSVGENNVYLGYWSGGNATGSNNIFLGYQSGLNETGSDLLYIDNSSTATPLIWGDFSSNLVNINGKLGIGINTPQEALHVAGSVRGDEEGGALKIKTAYGSVDIGPRNGTWAHFLTDRSKFYFQKEIHVNGGVFSSYQSDLVLQTASDTALTILNTNQNVGIGTSTPEEKLHVMGSIRGDQQAGALRVQTEAGYLDIGPKNSDWSHFHTNRPKFYFNKAIHVDGGVFSSYQSDLVLQTASDTALTILKTNQNVGIGTSTPEEKLHVMGSIRGDQQAGALRVQTETGYIDIGPKNSDWSHFHTNRPKFYFNKAIHVNGGVFSSYQSDLKLETGNNSALTILNTNQNVGIGTTTPGSKLEVAGDTKITGNLHLDGDLVYGQGIDHDPQAPKLLALDGFNKMVFHELEDIRNPWGLRFVTNALGTGLNCLDFTDSTGLVIQVDVLDIHGNLLLGNNGYIDDRDSLLTGGDEIWAGNRTADRDDWIRINDRIELSSSSLNGEGVAIFGKHTNSTQFLNLTQDGNDSYLANSLGLSGYFLKATGRDVFFGGNLTMPAGATATVGEVTTSTHGTSADWHGAASTVTTKAGNWDDAYTERGSQIAGNGLLWDGSQLSVDEIHLPWIKNGNNLSYSAGTVSTSGLISNVTNGDDLVFIGQQNGTESFRLFGNGIVEAKEVVVSLEIWPDYVFEEDYDLRPLEEVEAFVQENNHLPDVPSEEEVADEGVKVGEMEAILLQKVEELTLYLIDQNKQLKEQSELIQEQAQLIKKLQEKID